MTFLHDRFHIEKDSCLQRSSVATEPCKDGSREATVEDLSQTWGLSVVDADTH